MEKKSLLVWFFDGDELETKFMIIKVKNIDINFLDYLNLAEMYYIKPISVVFLVLLMYLIQ